ncbi:hypothetical protein CJF30_00008922 [Rutstroemia sp. NJR-2017a BBW]|nr:hypothetical protein CJF30_00008922 [Rutstroemia sp. NJR-2017a BBW]
MEAKPSMGSPIDDKNEVMFKDPFSSQLKKTSTNGSSKGLESPFDDYEQDWTTVTHERDSWATRERRRSTPFANMSNTAFIASHHEAKHGRSNSGSTARKGSILSVWTSPDGDEEENPTLVRVSSRKSQTGRDRRGSILSLWSNGKDENGRDIVISEGK